MDAFGAKVEQEYDQFASSSNFPPQPLERLQEIGPPPFLTKTYDMVDDQSTDEIVSWSSTCNSFVVWNLHVFSMSMLPRYFKHSNFSSFVRQLNTYGFRKVDPDRWEFANEGFLKGQKHLLKTIRRRRPRLNPPHRLQSLSPSLEIGRYALDVEIDMLKRDKNTLMAEVIKLRQEHQSTRACIKVMEERIQGAEHKQQQTMAFLARAMQNPDFLQQLQGKDLEDAITRKRRRSIDFRPNVVETPSEFVAEEVQELFRFEGSELESLEIEIEGLKNEEGNEDLEKRMGGNGELNDEFWDELLTEGVGEGKRDDV